MYIDGPSMTVLVLAFANKEQEDPYHQHDVQDPEHVTPQVCSEAEWPTEL